jgi:hypothetical protein
MPPCLLYVWQSRGKIATGWSSREKSKESREIPTNFSGIVKCAGDTSGHLSELNNSNTYIYRAAEA